MTEISKRRAELMRGSYDPKAGTFSAIAASGVPVPRMAFGGPIFEVLSMKPDSIRLGRFLSGRAPLLDSHRTNSLADQIGVITGARIEAGKLVADVKLSERDDDRMRQIRSDLETGILRNVSIGFLPFASEEREGEDGTPIIVRTSWEPIELSLVTVPADAHAHIRNLKGNTTMPELNGADDLGEQSTLETTTLESPAIASRMSANDMHEAYTLAARHGIEPDVIRRSITGGATLKTIRQGVLTRVAQEAAETHLSNRSPALGSDRGETFDNPAFLGRSIEGVLYARMSGTEPPAQSRELMGRSLLELGAMQLESRGEKANWLSRETLASQILTRDVGGHTTSDFPKLLMGAGNRILLDGYTAAASPLKTLARRRSVPDFRPTTLMQLSELPRLKEVTESGEVTYGSRSESKESFKLGTFARIFSITRQALINDDLNAFGDSNVAWGRAAAETENDLIVALFSANAGDGVDLDDEAPVYATARGNKAGSGGAITVPTLAAARQAMRETKSLDGVTPIGATPRHLVVSPAKETEAEQVLASLAAAEVAKTNPFSGKLTLHVEPRFTGNAWRIFADPAQVPVILIAYLNGGGGPKLEVRDGWSTLGVEYRAVLDFGCGLTDWRGTYLNPGA